MIYYYNLKSDEYSKYLEYTSEYSNIYTLFNAKNANEEITTINNKTTNYICVPVDIDLIEDNDTYYRRIFNNLQNETTFNYFNQSYFEKGIENGSFYFLTAYGKQDNWGTRFDLTSHGFLVDNKGQKVYHWDTGGIG